MKINKAGLDLIKEFEGFRAAAYLCPANVWTIGYGTTARADVGIAPEKGMVISEVEAEHYLEKTVDKFIRSIEPHILAPINENEFAAYVSLAYNIGPGAFMRSSTLRHFNEGNKAQAAKNILLWNKAGGKVLKGLVRRREAEKALFERPVLENKVAPLRLDLEPATAPSWFSRLLERLFAFFKLGDD